MKLSSIWQIEGTLTTNTSLHIGDGRVTLQHPENSPEIQTVSKTLDGRAVIPGSALKGVLRGALDLASDEMIDLFGQPEQGGTVQFLDSYSNEDLKWPKLARGRTAIDAVSGAAQDRLLFHLEEVPEKTDFVVRIRGKCFGAKRWQHSASLLNHCLQRFNDASVRLGAGESNHRGRCTWNLTNVRVMEPADLAAWLANPKPLDSALAAAPSRAAEISVLPARTAAELKALSLQLKFDEHHFLVNDARKTGKREAGKHAHAALRTAGRLCLPAESFRGVLAHQAARIARTRGHSADRQTVARHIEGQLPRARNALSRLFGAPGWGSVIEVEDFVEVSQPGRPFPAEPATQEFLAVDRFTGGGVEARKFDAAGGWQPILQGRLTVNLKRLSAIGEIQPAIGLFALTLRDLVEGDLSFGWGSGKGYGWARVDTAPLTSTEWIETRLAGWCDGNVKEWIEAWEKEGS